MSRPGAFISAAAASSRNSAKPSFAAKRSSEMLAASSKMETVECLIVGAGVIGLAVARALALAGREVIVGESESGIGQGVSSRNSEVIHAGIYYPTGLDKTRLCVDGKAMLYAFAQEFGVSHKRCGKLLVAVNEGEVGKLAALKAQAEANGGFRREVQPRRQHWFLNRKSGSHSEPPPSARFPRDKDGAAPMRLFASHVVNAAGLGAQALARSIAGMPAERIPPLHLAKGSCFSLRARSPFSRLIYPMPTPGGLGVHLTLDLAGEARFGPDVEWVDAIDYDVDPGRAASFAAAIRAYWPDLPDGALKPAYAGIRPKIARPGGSTTDFLIETERDHGVRGLINLFGIESPGLTASLAIADWIARRATWSRSP